MNELLVFLADGCEECEALITVDILRRAGLDTVTVSITDSYEIVSSHKIPIKADKLLSEVDLDAAEMLILPGGMPGTTNLEKCEKLMAAVDKFNKEGRPVSAICAAPGIFGRRGILEGRTATSYPTVVGELRGAKTTEESVACDGNVITSRGLGTAIDFGLAIVEKYKGRAESEKIASAIVYSH